MSQNPTQVTGATRNLREEIQAVVGAAYDVERQIAAGASARLFLARDTTLDRRVALKVLPAELSATVDASRFRREIRLAARLTHPNIVPLLSAGEARGTLYYTMPFVEGESLYERLARDGELPIASVVSIMRDLTKALAYAHAHGVVHRDLKPENVLLERDTALLTDFGIAKALTAARRGDERRKGDTPSGGIPTIDRRVGNVTAVGIAVGTPTYVSPEQAAGDPRIDHRTDLYSLGVVAYEMLTGQPPFTSRATQAVLAAHRSEDPPPIVTRRPGTPPWLAELVMRLLEKRAGDRPQSADDVLSLLEGETDATEPTLLHRNRAAGRRALAGAPARGARAYWVFFGAAIAVVVAALVVGTSLQRHHTPRPTSGLVATGVAAVRPASASPNAIAVLPFASVGDDRVEQEFADGLADELTSALGAMPGLRVASRTSVAALQAGHLTAVAVADALHVGRVLEGTVEHSGERLRITAQLTSASDGLALWSATYERPARDLFALQDEIAGDIGRALAGSKLTATVR
jgi:TolB-like protein/tRNA A-37 threonylcarbamoyl transferase component Bud32